MRFHGAAHSPWWLSNSRVSWCELYAVPLQDVVSGACWVAGDRLASAGDGGEVMVWAPPPDAEDESLVHTWKVCQLLRYGSRTQSLFFIAVGASELV